MQRVRQLLPYLKELGWEAVVIAVEPEYANAYSADPLLLHTIPADTEIHRVRAWDVRWTRKIGLGSLSIRAFTSIRRKGDRLLRERKFDLIYFSTTAFHVMSLGPRWKRKFGVPYILDIQDPWRSDFYLDKPKSERPPKFLINYNIDKYLERITVPAADGIISVSQGYCTTFLARYPGMQADRCRVIPFGGVPDDFDVMRRYVSQPAVRLAADKKNIVYVGRGGHDMRFALEIIFGAVRSGLTRDPDLFSNLHFWFIGTSYATAGNGGKTIEPIALRFGVDKLVTEIPDRIPYFDTLRLLDQADMLLVPGSIDESYTASKIYPYILAGRPLLAVFYQKSGVVPLFRDTRCGRMIAFDHVSHKPEEYSEACFNEMKALLGSPAWGKPDPRSFEPFLAITRAREQVGFFEEIIQKNASA